MPNHEKDDNLPGVENHHRRVKDAAKCQILAWMHIHQPLADDRKT